MTIIIFVLLLSIFYRSTLASFCGTSGVPFSLEILPSGLPILGCARPFCFGGAAGGAIDTTDDSSFYRLSDGGDDGYFRDGDRDDDLQRFRSKNAPPQKATCRGVFADFSCLRNGQWVGGIEKFNDTWRQPLIMQCCSYDGLKYSTLLGVTSVRPGEIVVGGEIVEHGRQLFFDIITNIRKIDNNILNRVSYNVTIRRMYCLPDPNEPEIKVDRNVQQAIIETLKQSIVTTPPPTISSVTFARRVPLAKPRSTTLSPNNNPRILFIKDYNR